MAVGVTGGARPVAVVGAGLAGLSAAWHLRRLGFPVEVFERSRLLGGKATSFESAGIEFDNGQHVFLGCFSEWRRLVSEVGMEDEIHLQPRFDALLIGAKGRLSRLRAGRLPAPLHLLPALLGHRLLGVKGRVQVARAMLAAHRPALDGETFSGWLDRLGQGPRARAEFWEPFLAPSLNAPLDQVDAEAGRFVLTEAFLSSPEACRIGWSKVPLARIAEKIASASGEVHRRVPVTGIRIKGPQVTGLVTAEGEVDVRGAVLAVPPDQLSRIVPDTSVLGIEGLDGFHTQPIVDVHLWYDPARPPFPGDFAALTGSPVQWVFSKQPGYVCCSMSAAAEWVNRPAKELIELCHRELATRLPALLDQQPRRGHATRDAQATFVPVPGLTRPASGTRLPNLALAGAWTGTGWPATMESAVRSGRAAARTLAVGLGVGPPAPRREAVVS